MKKSKIALAILAFYLPAGIALGADESQKRADASITVHGNIQPEDVNTQTLSVEKLQRIGANDFGSIMRYQPLISAVGSNSGSLNGKSSFDRGGYTGYNIRGLDANRISLDVNDIPLPDATGRSYNPTGGENTYGIGRDYIDPYLYGLVNISTGSPSQDKVNNAVGGSVSFISKSPDDYLIGDKTHYFSYTSNFDTSDHSWHNGITSAFGNDIARILLAYSRRDGQQTRNNSRTLDTYPMRWNSDAFLINGIYSPNDINRLSASLDFYRKSSGESAPMWKTNKRQKTDNKIGNSTQDNISQRYSFILKHEFTPEHNSIIDKMDNQFFYQQTHVADNTLENQISAPPRKIWTFSDLDTKTFGFTSEITKQYGIQSLNYGINFATSQIDRPFRQFQSPAYWYNKLQPQGNAITYDINAWIGDTMSYGAFSMLPQLKFTWHKINPKGFYDPASAGNVALSVNTINNLYNKKFNGSEILPALMFMYAFDEHFSTYLQYKRAVSWPTVSQIYGIWLHPNIGKASPVAIGNPDLKPETSNQFEWGVVGEAVTGITLRGSVFYNRYHNFIANKVYPLRDYGSGKIIGNADIASRFSSEISDLYLSENRDDAYIYGAELTSHINYGSWSQAVNGLSSNFAIGYNQGKAKSSNPGDGWTDIDSVLPVKAVISLAYDDPGQRYGVSLTATFVKGKQAKDTYRQNYSNNGQSGLQQQAAKAGRKIYMRIPGYGTVDLAAYYNISKSISVNAGIYNITNTKYWDYASNKYLYEPRPGNFDPQNDRDIELGTAPGRTYQVGLTATF